MYNNAVSINIYFTFNRSRKAEREVGMKREGKTLHTERKRRAETENGMRKEDTMMHLERSVYIENSLS